MLPIDLTLLPQPQRITLLDKPGVPSECPLVEVKDETLGPQHFVLSVGDGVLELSAGDDAARRYGRELCEQLRSQCDLIPAMTIEDWPDFVVRGYMLDISRNRVPTMETLRSLVELLARCRINHLQLYTEHTFAYRDHEQVWAEASPMTPAQVRQLDRWCVEVGIELVANQNSLGHFGRWLEHDAYVDRAEVPESSDPQTLQPNARNGEFVVGLFDEMLDSYSTPMINVGCDEPAELGQGQSAAECERDGTQAVYLRYLRSLVEPLQQRGVDVLFWGDVLRGHPELVRQLPSRGVTVLVWNYDAEDGFANHLESFVSAGLPFWVAPGTSTWNSFLGRLGNAKRNLLDAAVVGKAAGAPGFLITDWGDNGHWQPLVVSYPPIVYGAAVAWCAKTNGDMALSEALEQFVFEEETRSLAAVLVELGGIHEALGVDVPNATLDFANAVPLAVLPGVDVDGLAAPSERAVQEALTTLAWAQSELKSCEPSNSCSVSMVLELQAAVALSAWGLWQLQGRRQLEVAVGATPGNIELSEDRLRRAWLARSRPGGLEDSIALLGDSLR